MAILPPDCRGTQTRVQDERPRVHRSPGSDHLVEGSDDLVFTQSLEKYSCYRRACLAPWTVCPSKAARL
jgi:hypothetical protein